MSLSAFLSVRLSDCLCVCVSVCLSVCVCAGAIVVAAAKGRIGPAVNEENPFDKYPRDKDLEVPFNSSRKMMATIHKLPRTGR